MKRWKKDLLLFPIGSAGYGLVETLWRGHTHWTMLVAGGVCFLILCRVAELGARWPLLYRAAAGALGITAVELCFGLVFNRLLGMGVWDYSRQPLNFMGQICLGYTVLWGFLTLAVLPVSRLLLELLEQKTPRPIDNGEKEW